MKSYYIKVIYGLSLVSGLIFLILSYFSAIRWHFQYNEKGRFIDPENFVVYDYDSKLVFTFLSVSFFILTIGFLFIGRKLSKSLKSIY